MKQLFSCFWRFKIRARLGLGLAGRVGAVTTLGRSASPRWSHVRAAVHGRPWLPLAWQWPGYRWPRRAKLLPPAPCHDEATAGTITLSSCPRTTGSSHYRPASRRAAAAAVASSSHPRLSVVPSASLPAQFKATTVARTWPSLPSPCHLRHCGRTGHAGRKHARLSASAYAWAKARMSRATCRAPSLSFSLRCRRRATPSITLRAITSIQFSTSTSSPSHPLAARPHLALKRARPSSNLEFLPPPCR